MICVIGDTHGDYSRFSDKKIRSLKRGDYLIICGDFGFLWEGTDKERSILKKIGAKPFTTLFVTGSHDNYDLLSRFPEENLMGGMARNITGNLFMLSSGYIFNIDGKKLYAFGGGQSSDIDINIEGEAWWEQEVPDERMMDIGREVLRNNDDAVDYIITHEPPSSIAEFLDTKSLTVIPASRLGIYFEQLKGEVKFSRWFFGKLHKNKLIPPRYNAVFDEPVIINE